jgi:hypothetical protein
VRVGREGQAGGLTRWGRVHMVGGLGRAGEGREGRAGRVGRVATNTAAVTACASTYSKAVSDTGVMYLAPAAILQRLNESIGKLHVRLWVCQFAARTGRVGYLVLTWVVHCCWCSVQRLFSGGGQSVHVMMGLRILHQQGSQPR